MINYTYTSQHFMHQKTNSSDVFFMFQSEGVHMKQSLSSLDYYLVMLGSSDVSFIFYLLSNFFTYYLTNYGTRTNKPFKHSDYLLFIGFVNRNPKLFLI